MPLASPASAWVLLPAAAAAVLLLAAGVLLPPDPAALVAIQAVCCRQKHMASAEKLRSRAKGRDSRRGRAIQMLFMTACRSFCRTVTKGMAQQAWAAIISVNCEGPLLQQQLRPLWVVSSCL